MKKLITVFILISLTACSFQKRNSLPVNFSSGDSAVVKKLIGQYNEWRGVQYKIGGMSKNGIDCSAFVKITYQEKFDKKLPRTTELMSAAGNKISAKDLRPGDVVFFKTGWKVRHVGIYIGKGEFIHASTSRGVTKTKLNNPYWSNAYWMSRRY